MNLKRSFIPPSHRPYVRGGELEKEQDNREELYSDPKKRRAFLLALYHGEHAAKFSLQEKAREVLDELFPHLNKN